jgi:2-polyprenyl-6-hydroxyphenyl methylase/3-demethylubiquinone-9 3-methyltransferase
MTTALTDGMTDRDPAVRNRVFAAMMAMERIDIAANIAARKS